MLFDLQTYLVDDLLFLLDKTTMAASIEGRIPLLDHRLIEFMFSLPHRMLVNGSSLKDFVKIALKDVLPSDIINRKKMGFGAPVHQWIKKSSIGEILLDTNGLSDITKHHFNYKKINKDIKNNNYTRWHPQFYYNLIVFELWFKQNS